MRRLFGAVGLNLLDDPPGLEEESRAKEEDEEIHHGCPGLESTEQELGVHRFEQEQSTGQGGEGGAKAKLYFEMHCRNLRSGQGASQEIPLAPQNQRNVSSRTQKGPLQSRFYCGFELVMVAAASA